MTPTTLEPPPRTTKLREPKGAAQRYLAEGLTGETGADEAAARAAGMLPAELLQPGEIIILLLKPSPWFILLAPLRTLTSILVLAIVVYVVAGYTSIGLSAQNTVLAAAALMLARIFWQFLEWLSRVYVLTDRRVVTVAGVLRVLVFETPLEKVQHTNMHLSLRERLFALGSISFATAGTAFTEAWWLMLSSPLEVHQKIVQTLQRYRR